MRRNNTDYMWDGLAASMTVEASYVMAMVILCLMFLIRTAYDKSRQTAGTMRLHHVAEQMRFREENEERIFDYGYAQGHVRRKNTEIEAELSADNWKKEITIDLYEPEETLRFLTIFDQDHREGERNGKDGGIKGSVSQGNASELFDD